MTNLRTLYDERIEDGSLTADSAQVAILPQLDRIRTALMTPEKKGFFKRAPEPPKGLYLWGGVGRGKSMLMDMFAQNMGDVPTRRVHFHAFMQEIHNAMHEVRKTGVDDAIAPVAANIAATVRLLAFDEMQITDITDAMIVGRLFQALFSAGVVVVTTSNRPPDDLYKDGLNRSIFLPFIELIKARMEVEELISPHDYRQNRLAGAQSYFTPVNTESRTAMDAVWADLAGGPGDELGRSNFNEAKRFVTLIDALYEAKVRLICSAAATPEMLYLEGEGTFEFERTASRLREMQAEGWGS